MNKEPNRNLLSDLCHIITASYTWLSKGEETVPSLTNLTGTSIARRLLVKSTTIRRIKMRHRKNKREYERDPERGTSETDDAPVTIKHLGFLRSKSECVKLFALFVIGELCLFALFRFAIRPQENDLDGNALAQQGALATQSRRFPRFGSERFEQQCNWALIGPNEHGSDCTLVYRPRARSTEGIAEWVSQIAMTYASARLAGCRLMFDYGKHVDVGDVLRPFSKQDSSRPMMMPMNWTIPSGFSCAQGNRCAGLYGGKESASFGGVNDIPNTTLPVGASIPIYRNAYKDGLQRSGFRGLEQALPGFQVESGMACSLGALFDLAPNASQFEPELFSTILPTVRNEKALVMSVYIRTGQTDKVAKAEKAGNVLEVSEKLSSLSQTWQLALDCALSLEEKYLTGGEELSFDKIVWMVVTDLPPLKQYIIDNYHAKDANLLVPAEKRKWNSSVIPREVVTTGSRGVHSRAGRNPSTADFAEALIDWLLIGESDLVITSWSWYSFGATAALRTARPLYDGRQCTKLVPVHGNATA